MLATFFVAQLLKDISSDNLESEMLIVNMLNELLLNCSARDLKTNWTGQKLLLTTSRIWGHISVNTLPGIRYEQKRF